MPRAPLFAWLAGAALAAGALAVGCTYSPSFRQGALKCSASGECPRGYSCSSARTCCLPDDPTCGGSISINAGAGGNSGAHFDGGLDLPGLGTGGTTTGTGGHGGQPGTSGGGGSTGARLQNYVGVWTFSSTASVTTNCDNPKSASGVVTFAPGTTLTITDNGNGTLNAVWTEWMDCPYTLTVDSAGAHGNESGGGWFCEYTAADPQEYWIYDSFDLVLSSATAGAHDGVYEREDDWADGTTVYCQQTVHAPVTKN